MTNTIDRGEFREKRIELCISQEEFAKIAGISYRTIIRFEKGDKIRKGSMNKILRTMRKIKTYNKTGSFWWKSHKKNLKNNLFKKSNSV